MFSTISLLFTLLKRKLSMMFGSFSTPETPTTSTFNLSFVKLANRWYADIPTWEGSADNLEMVARADDLLEFLSKGKKIVSLQISYEPIDKAIELTKIKTDVAGATYRVENLPDFRCKTIWLCNVTKFVCGGIHPDKFYFKQID